MRAPHRSTPRTLLETLLVALVFALWARTFLVQAFSIPTPSMEPTLRVGDHVLVNKFVFRAADGAPLARLLPAREVRRGDVVVFRSPDDPRRDFVKRCLGLPGDRVEIRDKQLLLDGRPLDEGGWKVHRDATTYGDGDAAGARRRDQYGPRHVPAGHLFCLGDNRDESNDSRFWGPVPRGAVKGRALLVYWSTAPPVGGEAATAWRRLRARLTGTRWERTFRGIR